MPMNPIFTTLRKHKLTVGLLIVQVALTFAIVANAAFLIGSRVERMLQPSGLIENQISLIDSTSIAKDENLHARHATDLVALRAIPGVQSAVAMSHSLPLSGSVDSYGVCPDLEQLHKAMQARSADGTGCIEPNAYWGTQGQIQALGIHLVAGRDFHADEYVDEGKPPVAIVTRTLAEHFYPGQSALGQSMFLGSGTPIRIVGVVDPLLPPYLNTNGVAQYTMVWPRRPDSASVTYAMRSAPDAREQILKVARTTLMQLDPQRIIDPERVWTYSDMRHEYFHRDITMIGLLLASALGLLFVTALGIGGLASFWVGQRRRSIGIRRAVGATRTDILRYFQTENFLIVSAGVIVGALLAVGLNLWLMQHYELTRLPWIYLPTGALALWLLGQLAVLSPALRASRVPPVVATRSG